MNVRVSWLGKVLKPDSETIAASIRRLEKFVTPDSDRAERRKVEQFAAYRWNGSDLSQDRVSDISSTGLYLVTQERWQPGTILALTLQREGPLDPDPARRITTQARVVLCGNDGVGLTFLWSKEDPRSRQWDSLLESLIAQTRPGDMRSLAQMVEAFALLGQICPEGAAEIGEWVTRASSHKILNAVAIMLKAEELLYTEHRGKALEVSPQLAVRILEVGSETHEAWLQRFWAGLLISSTSDGSQQSLLDLVELFSQLTSIPNRIFTVVCTKAIKALSDKGEVTAKPLAFKPEELASTVGARGPQLQRDLTSLVYLNLIEKSASSSSALHASNEISITPTTLGLQLFALCNGHRGPIRDFYFVDAAQPATAG